MAGIINGAMGQVAGLAQQPQQQPQGGGQQPDHKAVERVVLAALKIVHDPRVGPQLIEIMRMAGDPVQALVKSTLLVMRQVYEKSGNSIPPDVLGNAGVEVMNEMALIATRKKFYDITPEIFQEAVNVALEEAKQGGQQPQAAAPGAAAPAPAEAAAEPVAPEEEGV